MDFVPNLFNRGGERPPPPEVATLKDAEEYGMEVLRRNRREAADTAPGDDPTMAMPFVDEDFQKQIEGAKHKAEFPWLSDPKRGVRWDFDPIELRNLGQANTWVGMLVQSITKEIAQVPFTIVEAEGPTETSKRLGTHPEERDPIAKELVDSTAERIFENLHDPNPDDNWQDTVEMWLADLLEVGSMSVVKAFPESDYEDDQLVTDPALTEPVAIQTSAPEVWTKDYHDRTGILDGFWQFDRTAAPGEGSTTDRQGTRSRRGIMDPTFFDTSEVIWDDMSPRSNRRYGMPPTLLVKDFLQSIDLAVTQEQQYLSRGSIPSGAWVFEQWDRNEVKEWKSENEENIKGKPHKSLMFAGRGGDVRFEPMSMNFKELEFTERMRWYARVVASVFQVPTAVVGIEPEKINYHTFQGERENFEANTLGPYLQKLERVVNDQYINPHWPNYRFEFKPGMSESTRGMISERVRSEFNAGITTRNEARHELGRDAVDEEEDGFKDEVVDEPDPEAVGDAMNDLVAGRLSKQEGEFSADIFRVVAPEEDADRFDDRVLGIGVDFPNDAVYVDWRNEVFPDELAESHVSIYGSIEDLEQATGNGTEAMDTLDAAASAEVANSVLKAVGGPDTGNPTARKDGEPLRNTDNWEDFDVQPHEIAALQDDIADDVDALFSDVLDDPDVREAIAALATDDDETEKSLNDVTRRIRDLLTDNDTAQAVAEAIETHTAEQVEAAVERAVDEEDEAEVDTEPVKAELESRSQDFADRFANQMSEQIRDTVAEGWEEGMGSQDIAEEIGELADMESGWQGAERIARQELQVASGKARNAAADQLGKVEVWVTSGDNRVRDAHAEMDGLWKHPDEEFAVDYDDRGVQKEEVPGDSEPGIGCRCSVLLRDREEVNDRNHAGV